MVMTKIKYFLQSIKSKIASFFNLILKKELSLKNLCYIAFLSLFLCYFAISPIVRSIETDFIRRILLFLIILFYIRHIYLIKNFFPKKDKIEKHKRTFWQIILLRNPRSLNIADGIKIIIAFDLFAIAVFVGYFS
jgi:hypothetical protein